MNNYIIYINFILMVLNIYFLYYFYFEVIIWNFMFLIYIKRCMVKKKILFFFFLFGWFLVDEFLIIRV